jgi:hypothetical protein
MGQTGWNQRNGYCIGSGFSRLIIYFLPFNYKGKGPYLELDPDRSYSKSGGLQLVIIPKKRRVSNLIYFK